MMAPAVHTNVQGEGLPVVVLESGIAASSVSWVLVQRELAKFTKVVSYDRPGFGFSDAPSHKSTAFDAAKDLAAMLAETGLPDPYILVGHSFGGLIVRVFQQMFPDMVCGLVLLDPVARSEWRQENGVTPDRARMLARGVMLSRRGAWLARIGVVGFALRMLTGGFYRLPTLLAKASAGEGSSLPARLIGEIRKLPNESWPVVASNWSHAKPFRTMANSLENLPVSAGQLDETRSLGDLPVIVLSSASSTPAALDEHAREAGLSTRGKHEILEGVGHWVQLDAPEAVCRAVLLITMEQGGFRSKNCKIER